jgi:hypothetical protein
VIYRREEAAGMIVIYIKKSWLDTIGDTAKLLRVREESNDHVSILAANKRMDANFPFVEAYLAREEVTENGEVFILSRIPVGVVTGIFDLTKKETSKYGFHETEKTL